MVFGQKYRVFGMCVTNILRFWLSVEQKQVKKSFPTQTPPEDGEEERIAGAEIHKKNESSKLVLPCQQIED